MKPWLGVLLALSCCAASAQTGPSVADLKLAESGDGSAASRVGHYYLFEERNFGEAARWFRVSAEQGNAGAQFQLGTLLEMGWGVEQDYAAAASMYQAAADSGLAGAQCFLGQLYLAGRGVTQDYEKAAELFRRAAEQGNAPAQTRLGEMYSAGLGVIQDHSEAVAWFTRSANQQDASGLYRLGQAYEAGLGVMPDAIEAAAYYRLAAETSALTEYLAAQNRAAIALSADDWARVVSRVAAWRRAHPRRAKPPVRR